MLFGQCKLIRLSDWVVAEDVRDYVGIHDHQIVLDW